MAPREVDLGSDIYGVRGGVSTSLDVIRAELTTALSSAPGIAAADELCATCVGLFGVDAAAMSMVHEGAATGTFGSSSDTSRRLDEYQFTFGEGPCLDAVASREAVLVPNLEAPQEQRWPLLRDALLDEGVRSVFALPIMITSVCAGALDLFRSTPGPLTSDEISGAMLAAEFASAPLLDVIAATRGEDAHDDNFVKTTEAGPDHLAELEPVEVYQATGWLRASLHVDADEAMVRLRAHAIATGQTPTQVARAILERRLVLEKDPQGGG